MRMPVEYSRLFGPFFYPEVYGPPNFLLSSFSKEALGVGFVLPVGKVVTKTLHDKTLVYNVDSYKSISKVAEATNGTVLTPFLGQRVLYTQEEVTGFTHPTPGVSKIDSFTFRPSQGITRSDVYLDLLKTTNYLSVSNSDAIVALSRHTRSLTISGVPDYKNSWLSRPYVYDENATVHDNYLDFIENSRKANLSMVEHDHNGDHEFKWRYFVWLLEHLKCPEGPTQFRKMAEQKVFSFKLYNEINSLGGDERKAKFAYLYAISTLDKFTIHSVRFDDVRYFEQHLADIARKVKRDLNDLYPGMANVVVGSTSSGFDYFASVVQNNLKFHVELDVLVPLYDYYHQKYLTGVFFPVDYGTIKLDCRD